MNGETCTLFHPKRLSTAAAVEWHAVRRMITPSKGIAYDDEEDDWVLHHTTQGISVSRKRKRFCYLVKTRACWKPLHDTSGL